MKDVWVISLGGSRIVPDSVDDKFLLDFKKLLDSHKSKKFVVVTGGGSTARKYMSALRRLDKSTKKQSREGIAITRLHARFMSRFFGKGANEELPFSMKKVRSLLSKNHVVFCGALRQTGNQTSDGTAAKLAGYLNCSFINLTNIKGLYSSNPKTNKKAKFISKISWNDFYKMASRIKFSAGQHFVLDQTAAKEIKDKKITTYIVGSLKAIDDILKRKKFVGTVIK
jgi:uridylate kinase